MILCLLLPSTGTQQTSTEATSEVCPLKNCFSLSFSAIIRITDWYLISFHCFWFGLLQTMAIFSFLYHRCSLSLSLSLCVCVCGFGFRFHSSGEWHDGMRFANILDNTALLKELWGVPSARYSSLHSGRIPQHHGPLQGHPVCRPRRK